MKGNNEKMKWYFLIAVALIVGAIIGYFATNILTTEGNAKLLTKITSYPDSIIMKRGLSYTDCVEQGGITIMDTVEPGYHGAENYIGCAERVY